MTITYPDFIKIMNKCKDKMKVTYLKYGNSWLKYQGLKFWKNRLDGEIDEIWKAKTFEEYQKEIIDAINVLSMMHDRHDDWLFSEVFRKQITKIIKGNQE